MIDISLFLNHSPSEWFSSTKKRRSKANFAPALVGVSLKDLAKPSKINGLQAAGKVLLFKNNLKSRIAPPE